MEKKAASFPFAMLSSPSAGSCPYEPNFILGSNYFALTLLVVGDFHRCLASGTNTLYGGDSLENFNFSRGRLRRGIKPVNGLWKAGLLLL